MQPLIGIPPCLDDRGRWRAGRDYHYIDSAYARAVHEAGGQPVYLPQQGDARAAAESLHGLLLPGGDDLAPPTPYPDSVHFELAPETQLRFDSALLEVALERGLPVLGICYGMQLLAQAYGGSLHYDIATDLPAANPHQLPDGGAHDIEIEPDSRLAPLWPATQVNSLHHQAARDPGALRVVARAPDGVIEALEAAGPEFVIGVQWHPEKHEAGVRAPLFEAFVSACASPQQV